MLNPAPFGAADWRKKQPWLLPRLNCARKGTVIPRAALGETRRTCPEWGLGKRARVVARFARTLGTLITSGVPILEGIAITARTSGNAIIEEALLNVRQSVEEGRNMMEPLRESGVFPNMVCHMVSVGEATGALDNMLGKIADFYEDDVDVATKDLLASLEPLIIGFLGVVVGGIVLSLYMPLFSMISKLAG